MPRTSTTNGRLQAAERLSVNISSATAQALREIAASKSTTVTEVVRRAVAVLKLLEDEQGEGTQVQLVSKNAPVRVLHII